jgi:hypothetical protein
MLAIGVAIASAPLTAGAEEAAAATAPASASAPAPASVAASVRDCARITQDLQAAKAARQEARARQADAWKVVVPFAVAGRYAKARAAGSEADARVEALSREAAERGCDAR